MNNQNFAEMVTTARRTHEQTAYILQTTKLYFHVEGIDNTDKVYYNKVVRQKLCQLLNIDYAQVPIEICSEGKCREVWEKFEQYKEFDDHYYIVDADFNMISKLHRNTYPTFHRDFDGTYSNKVFITCGYSIENYGITDEFVKVYNRRQPKSVKTMQDLNNFLLNIKFITIIQYLCFVIYRGELDINSVKNILNDYIADCHTQDFDDTTLCSIHNELQNHMESHCELKQLQIFRDKIQELDIVLLDWIKYTRGKSIFAFFKRDTNINEEIFIQYLIECNAIPPLFTVFLENIVNHLNTPEIMNR